MLICSFHILDLCICVRPKKKTCVSGKTVSPKLMRPCVFFVFFLLVRFLNRGKRSEMVSVVSRYERNEI